LVRRGVDLIDIATTIASLYIRLDELSEQLEQLNKQAIEQKKSGGQISPGLASAIERIQTKKDIRYRHRNVADY
jgi:hypothetical protein